MFQPSDLAGAMPAIITFMKPDPGEYSGFAVDYEATCRHATSLVEKGVAGIVIAGTTGQSATLTNDEHIELCGRVARAARTTAYRLGREVKVIVSAGSNCTASAMRMVEKTAASADPDAFLHVTGYYNNPPQEGIVHHFTMVADFAAKFDKPIVLYNVPSRTNSMITAESTAELARHPNIVGIKEASGDLGHVRKILALTDRATFAVTSGEDGLVADIMDLGGVGVITAAGNVWPAEFQRLCELHASGQREEARELQNALMPTVEATFAAKNPIPLHYMLHTDVRPPLIGLEEFHEPRRTEAMTRIAKARAIAAFPFCYAAAVAARA